LGKLLAAAGTLADAKYRFARIDRLVVPNRKPLADAFRAPGAKVIYAAIGCTSPDLVVNKSTMGAFWLHRDRHTSKEHECA
jgi:hypothetical protein